MNMLEKLCLPEIRELIQQDDRATLREVLADWPAADVADLMIDLLPEERRFVRSCITADLALRTFVHLPLELQREILRDLPEADATHALNEMAPDDRTTLLEGLDPEAVERWLTLLTPANQRIARSLLAYGAGTVGRLMTPDYIAAAEAWTVEQVLSHVRKVGRDSESLNAVYVVDAENRLVDDIRMREILLASPSASIRSLMDHKFIAIGVNDPESTAVEMFRKYDRTLLPVVDSRVVLLGIVTVDDVLDVAQEEATREIQRFGGIEALEEPYAATPMLQLVRKRGSWLIILFLGELLTASAMGAFEKEIEKAVVLALFVPLIISSGGNSGSQAATLIVRALAVGEVKLRQWWWVARRELASGLILGLVLGTIGFLRIALWSQFSTMYGPHWALVALTVGLSLIGIVLWGTLSGSMLPFALKRLGFDPATSSAPFVATLVDVTGLVIYFTVAHIVLRGTLL